MVFLMRRGVGFAYFRWDAYDAVRFPVLPQREFKEQLWR